MSYDPAIGRWATADPAGYVDGLNLYQMSRSNPVISVDPSGFDSATTLPTPITITHDPIEIGGPGHGKGQFGGVFVGGPGWGNTNSANGQITTDLYPLALPSPLPECLEDIADALQDQIDDFNAAALAHEQFIQQWQQTHDTRNPGPLWESISLAPMYARLITMLSEMNCKCPSNQLNSYIKSLQNTLSGRLRYIWSRIGQFGQQLLPIGSD